MFAEVKETASSLLSKVETTLETDSFLTNKKKLAELLVKQKTPDFFNQDFKIIKDHNQKVKNLEKKINPWLNLKNELLDLVTLIGIAEEEKEEDYLNEINQKITSLSNELNTLEKRHFFKEEIDETDCYLIFQAGAGGTESCDWAAMLYRLYTRWAEKKEFKISVIDYQSGEEVGLKSAILLVEGIYSYGLLKVENGVHRLVRISPFDANKKRHTSFVSLSVIPEIKDDIVVDINPSDLRIDTYRSSGAGGQHVNTTDSAVRITHLPTHIVVACQAERSQHQNKEKAMKILRAKLYEHYKQEKQKKESSSAGEKKKIEWGSQIRSYVFHPYNMIKDHRTNFETGNIGPVMDGEIDEFIYSYLKQQAG